MFAFNSSFSTLLESVSEVNTNDLINGMKSARDIINQLKELINIEKYCLSSDASDMEKHSNIRHY